MPSAEQVSARNSLAHAVDVFEVGRVPLRLLLCGPVVIGRDCDGLLLGDQQMSRRHLELRPSKAGIEITDLGSSNGTFIDELRIESTRVLSPGSAARAGTTVIVAVDATPPESGKGRATIISPTASHLHRTSIDDVADVAASNLSALVDRDHQQGTITIVFSDIEGSTELVTRVGDERWLDDLTLHNQLIRACVRRFEGTVIKNQGDGFMLTFGSARRAVQAMSAAQQELENGRVQFQTGKLRVRVGMHTGEVLVDDDGDIFGHHVHVAARVAGHAAGGEIVVSSLTRAILESRADIAFGPDRSVHFKGVPGTHIIHPVLWAAQKSSPAHPNPP